MLPKNSSQLQGQAQVKPTEPAAARNKQVEEETFGGNKQVAPNDGTIPATEEGLDNAMEELALEVRYELPFPGSKVELVLSGSYEKFLIPYHVFNSKLYKLYNGYPVAQTVPFFGGGFLCGLD